MRKKIFFVLLIFISTKIYSVEDKHERISIEKEKLLEIELDLSCVAEFYSYSGYNTYTTMPQIGCNFTLLNDYVFSIHEPVTIQLSDINSAYPESVQNGLKFTFDDFSYTFVTPQIKNKATGWIPGILNTGINFTSVMNNYFSISCSGSVRWNSGQHIDKRYISGLASISESIQVQIS